MRRARSQVGGHTTIRDLVLLGASRKKADQLEANFCLVGHGARVGIPRVRLLFGLGSDGVGERIVFSFAVRSPAQDPPLTEGARSRWARCCLFN